MKYLVLLMLFSCAMKPAKKCIPVVYQYGSSCQADTGTFDVR